MLTASFYCKFVLKSKNISVAKDEIVKNMRNVLKISLSESLHKGQVT